MRRMLVLGVSALTAGLAGCQAEAELDNRPVWARGSVIEAQGRAYVELAPNRARFTASYEARSSSSEEASAAVVQRANAVAAAIREASGGEVRVTSNLEVRPFYRQVNQRFGEFSERLVENVHPDALLGYVATVTVNVVMLDPERTSAARGAALAGGPISSAPVIFFLEPTAENQRLVFAAAVDDAAQRARIVAEAADRTLGDILVLQEGSGPCLGAPATAAGSYVADGLVSRGAAPPPPAPPPPPPPPPGSVEGLLENAERYALAADQQPQRVQATVCAIFAVE